MNGVERMCPICGNTYVADPARLRFGRQTTCSRACSYAARSMKQTNRQTLICSTCGSSFERPLSHVKSKHGGQFCSRSCHYAGRSLGTTKRIVTKPYTYTDESKARLIATVRQPKGERAERAESTCERCGTVFRLSAAEMQRRQPRFCSIACIGAAQRGQNNPAWRGGYRPYYGPDWRPMQRVARKRDAYTCQRCGITQKALGRQLDVHHITPVSSFANVNDANTADNLVTLCHSCHMAAEWESGQR